MRSCCQTVYTPDLNLVYKRVIVRLAAGASTPGGTNLATSSADKKIDLLFLISGSTNSVAALLGLA